MDFEQRLTRMEQRQDETDLALGKLSDSVRDSVAEQQQNHNELKALLIANNRVSVSLFARLTNAVAALWRRQPRS